MILFQEGTSFGIPAEGVYTGLVVILMLLCIVLAALLVSLFRRYQKVTEDSIKGFSEINLSLNALRENLQIGDNSMSNKLSDVHKDIKQTLEKMQKNVEAHLQYIRDRSN